MIKWLAFVKQYGDCQLKDLDEEAVRKLVEACGVKFPVHDALIDAAVQFCKGKDIHTVSQAASQPEAVAQLILLFKKGINGLNQEFQEVEDELRINQLLEQEL